MNEKTEKIKKLVKLLNKASDAYYNTGNTIMEDFEFDRLVEELRMLEEETGLIMATSPTHKVGYEVKSSLEKVKHNHPMLSLDKTKSLDDVVKFIGNHVFVAMPKMDGLTCSVRYLDGKLVSAETRGNGEIGESVLHCARVVKNLPLQIDYKDELIVDGEMIIADNDFAAINAKLPDGEKYKNARNLVSGSIRQLDSSIAAQRNIRFVAWKCVTPIEVKNGNSNSFAHRLAELNRMGFETVINYRYSFKMLNSLAAYRPFNHIEQLEMLVSHIKNWASAYGYPLDGCVFGYDDIAYGESLGATGHHLRSQYAFKFYDELHETKLNYIDWTLGKTSVLTPTAVFNPVEIDGTEVNRASLHNISIIKSLGLTNNCTVRVFKANMIIPQIDSCNNDGDGEIIIPETCPVCGGATDIKKDNESEVLVCTNPNCTGKKLAQFTHFVSRNCMDINGLSEATLEKLISLGYIDDFKSIYHLSDHTKELVKLDGFGAKSIQKLLQAIEKSRDVRLENFIAALGIPNIGLSAAKIIASHCNHDINALFDADDQFFDWEQLDDIGPTMAKSINDFFDNNFKDVFELAKELNFIKPEQKNDNSLDSLKFCITGSFSQSRDELKKKLEARGAKFVSSISKNLDILFCGDKAGSKLAKAQSLGVKIAHEDELLKMLEE